MHIVFVDSNLVGLNAMSAAKAEGHEVSFLCSNRFQQMVGGRTNPQLVDIVNRILIIDDPLVPSQLNHELSKLNAISEIHAVLSVLDFCTLAVAEASQVLGLRHTSLSAIKNSQDKEVCRNIIENANLPSCKHALVVNADSARAFAAEVGFPIILKPQRGAASLLAKKIDDAAAIDGYFSMSHELDGPLANTVSPSILAEEYLSGPLMSVEVIAAGSCYLPLMVCARKRCSIDPSIEIGTTMPAPVSEEIAEQLSQYAVAAAKAVGLDFGIFHIEMILTDRGPVLVEINPRIMGGNMPTLYRLATKVDPYQLLLKLYLAGEIPRDELPKDISSAASTRMIGLLEAGNVTKDLQPDWFTKFKQHTVAWQFDIQPNQAVPAMKSSFNPYFLQVVGANGAESSLLAEWLISAISVETGLKLRCSAEDYLFTSATQH